MASSTRKLISEISDTNSQHEEVLKYQAILKKFSDGDFVHHWELAFHHILKLVATLGRIAKYNKKRGVASFIDEHGMKLLHEYLEGIKVFLAKSEGLAAYSLPTSISKINKGITKLMCAGITDEAFTMVRELGFLQITFGLNESEELKAGADVVACPSKQIETIMASFISNTSEILLPAPPAVRDTWKAYQEWGWIICMGLVFAAGGAIIGAVLGAGGLGAGAMIAGLPQYAIAGAATVKSAINLGAVIGGVAGSIYSLGIFKGGINALNAMDARGKEHLGKAVKEIKEGEGVINKLRSPSP